jgi:hypothetical protein
VKLELVRRWRTADTIIGTLTVDGIPECYVLESLEHAIPCGTYRVTLYDSPKHGRVPLLHDVPGRTWIEIHAGNSQKDTTGCLLVGLTRKPAAVEQSRLALGQLVKKIDISADQAWIDVREVFFGAEPVA